MEALLKDYVKQTDEFKLLISDLAKAINYNIIQPCDLPTANKPRDIVSKQMVISELDKSTDTHDLDPCDCTTGQSWVVDPYFLVNFFLIRKLTYVYHKWQCIPTYCCSIVQKFKTWVNPTSKLGLMVHKFTALEECHVGKFCDKRYEMSEEAAIVNEVIIDICQTIDSVWIKSYRNDLEKLIETHQEDLAILRKALDVTKKYGCECGALESFLDHDKV